MLSHGWRMLWTALTAVLVVVITALVVTRPLVAAVIAPLLVFVLAGRVFAPVLLSPVKIVALIVFGTGLAGWLGYHGGRTPSGGVATGIRPALADATLITFSATASAILIGSLVFAAIFRRSGPNDAGSDQARPITAVSPWLWVIVGACVLLTLQDPASLLHRQTYLQGQAGSIGTGIVATAADGAILLLGYLARATRRYLPCVALAVYFGLVLFALGTRQMALAPIAFMVGFYVASRTRRALWGVLVAALVTALLFPIPLYLRGLASHGLIPYLGALPNYLHDNGGWSGALYNVVNSFPITGQTVDSPQPTNWATMQIEFNPAPGGIAGWYDISRSQRLNSFTPFSSIGEIRHVGWAAVAVLWGAIGFVLAYLERRIAYWLRSGSQFVAFAIIGTTALFGTLILQYNVRSSMRMLYYAILIDLLVRAARSLRVRSAPIRAVGERIA